MRLHNLLKKSVLIGMSLALAMAFIGCVDPSSTSSNEADKKRCYSIDTEKNEITFIYDFKLWKQTEKVTSAYVMGSFNSWLENENYKMNVESDRCTLTVGFDKLAVLGNSGHPEYKFRINGKWMDNFDKTWIPEPYCFHTSDNNLIIIYDNEDINEIKELSNKAGIRKTLTEWNISESNFTEVEESKLMEFANFRKVPGTTQLYRSMHPFKIKCFKSSKGYCYETEPTRIAALQYLYQKAGIKSDINVSENYNNPAASGGLGLQTVYLNSDKNNANTSQPFNESIPDFYQTMIDEGKVKNVSYTDTESVVHTPLYENIYQAAFNPTYLNGWLKDIIDFINDDASEAPFDLHCRLGNDRTGFYCAVIAGLCGADWNSIKDDYQKSNLVYMQEYRDYRLLKQVFEKLYHVEDVSTVENLKSVMVNYYTTDPDETGISITAADIEKMVAKLKQ